MPQIFKDTIGLAQSLNNTDEVNYAKRHGIPTLKGILYKQNIGDDGKPIFEKVADNTVVLGGALLALRKLFGVQPSYMPPTINEIMSVNDNITVNPESTYIKYFAVGTGGSGLLPGTAIDPDFKMKELADWVPFRISDTNKLPSDIASKYHFRMQISPDPAPQWGWYLKEFEQIVTPKSLWKDVPDPNEDGTEITSDISTSTSDNLVECFGECIIRLEKDDLRPYFQWAGNLQTAVYNSFALFTGMNKEISAGYNDAVGVQLFSCVNFNNVPLDLATASTYLYRVYAAV